MQILENQSQLPREKHQDDHVVEHGFAVGVGHRHNGQAWWFFLDRKDAFDFGALARRSRCASGYGVYPAAQEAKYDGRSNTDSWTLYVGDTPIDRHNVGSAKE